MTEPLICPKCGHRIQSKKSDGLANTTLVGCTKCGIKTNLGEWRNQVSEATEEQTLSSADLADVPPPIRKGNKRFRLTLGSPTSGHPKTEIERKTENVLIGCVSSFIVLFVLCGGCLYLTPPVSKKRQMEIRDEALRNEIEDERAKAIYELDRDLRKQELRREP